MTDGIIDTHFHIWDLSLRRTFDKTDSSFDWPDSSLPLIHRDILIDEAASQLTSSRVDGAIFVQCLNGCPQEVKWVENLATKYPLIKGIVGGLDLTQDPEALRRQIREFSLLVGLRHILDVEDHDWLLRDEVQRGLKVVEEENLVFDCLVRPHILKHVATLAPRFPSLRFVIDHISKPYISQGEERGLSGWREDMTAAAAHENVYCKLSGMVTEVDPDHHNSAWSPDTFKPYVEHCLKVFGVERCMFGSDWPVCRLAGAEHNQVV